ncbi:MAG: D-alanyl-D-alanine carboxypeptidase [Clostridia bacterium]|nr:D-alanyl-D-alanine carboxypeptidase [Clostridia bacterium]
MKRTVTIFITLCFLLNFTLTAFATNISVAEEIAYTQSPEISDDIIDVAAVSADVQIETYAKAVVLMEKSTGKVLYAENENEQLYPASVTKIMTILLVCEAIDSGRIKLSDEITCTATAASKGGSQIWLEQGEIMTVEELLKATCIYSANDACTLLGEYLSGSEEAFVTEMNKKAEQLGMTNTHFDNCSGLDDTTETHLTTAYDIALMARELMANHDFIKQYTTVWMDSLRDGETQLVNTNKLIRYYDGITGLKTGTTEKAGCCICATAERDSMELIAVVLGSDNSNDRFTSAQNLLNWGFANYKIVQPVFDSSLVWDLKVTHGKEENVALVIPSLSALLVNKNNNNEINIRIDLPESVEAPVDEGAQVGKVKVYLGEEVVSEYDITTASAVEKINFFTAFYKLLTCF